MSLKGGNHGCLHLHSLGVQLWHLARLWWLLFVIFPYPILAKGRDGVNKRCMEPSTGPLHLDGLGQCFRRGPMIKTKSR